jgi:cytochrome c peroxidase
LRNVALTAPYMHDGSIATLQEVIAHYQNGGRAAANGHGGRDSPIKNAHLQGFELTMQERDDIVAFLTSLTDDSFVVNPAFADPWPTNHPAVNNRRMTAGGGK